ncbi:MAG TPA: S8 family serine peptidase, partial [Aquella sp.]|nr:S8 family serine peptidase [Aquella sp.]
MFKNFCLALICCSLTSMTLASNRFIIKYKPNAIQSQALAKGGKEAKAAIEQMMKPLSSVQIKILSGGAPTGVNIIEINQIATGAHVIITDRDLSATETKNFIYNLQKQPDVEYIEEDQILKPVTIKAANPGWQWNVDNSGEFAVEPGWIGDDFLDAWTALDAAGYGVGTNVVIGVIDTGYTPHPNFLSALQQLGSTNGVYGYQFISDCRISGQCSPSTLNALAINYPYQANALDLGDYVSQSDINSSNGFFTPDCLSTTSSWHGSHVTGIIAANGYTPANPTYIAGGAYGATVVPVRVLGKCGGYISDVTNGMLWASGLSVSSNGAAVPVNPNPVQVMNLSLGGSGSCTNTEQAAINAINANGTIIVVAAGNNQGNISSFNPSGCSGVIVVAARGPTNTLAFYSNYGATTITAS